MTTLPHFAALAAGLAVLAALPAVAQATPQTPAAPTTPTTPALAAEMPLADPALEARAQALMREIRCVACENEPISQSASDISIDMRRAVRRHIAHGASDTQIRDWFAARYGQFVLFRPPDSGPARLLWAFPFLLLAGSAMILLARKARQKKADTALPD